MLQNVLDSFKQYGPEIFTAVYAVARVLSHLVKPYTIVGKACAWILGHLPGPPTQVNVTGSGVGGKTPGV